MENSKEQLNDHDMVVDFLRRISTATGALAQIDDEDQCMTDDSELNVADLVDKIARNLLSACHPHILASGISNLPSLETCADEKLTMEQSNEEENWKAYNYRRSDYLRRLLRVMASISMDVLANICSIVVSSQKTQPSVNQSSFLLISHWLPVAPHLASMATDLLKTLVDPLKITESNTQDTQFLVAETCHHLCSFYMQRGEISTIRHLWDWSFVFGMLEPGDTEMSTSETLEMHLSPCFPTAIRWFSARILTYLLDWKPSVVASVLAQLELEDKLVPWTIHPWALDQEELDMQNSHFQGRTRLWESDEFSLPSSEQIQKVLSTSACLAKIGPGLTFYRRDTIIGMGDAENLIHQGVDAGEDSGTNNHLVPTPTTCRNLSLLGAALCEQPHPAPILICGPHGSGKSSLVRELLRLCRPKDSLLEFHIDEETDSKTLIGSYTITDIPGEFAWRPGALTHATREGRWVLLEDVDSVPSEIQATLVKLLEDRMLPLGNGEYEPCHPNFRIFGTCTTSSSQQQQQRHSLRVGANRGGGKRILNPSLWRKVHVRPLPYSELKQVAMSLYNDIPESIFDSALSLLQTLDRSGRTETTQLDQQSDDDEGEGDDFCATLENRTTAIWTGGRVPSVRDFFKLFSRISNDICFEKNVAYTTEAQRTLCLAESVDIFVGSCPERDSKRDFVSTVAAPIWGISRDLALSYVETRRPPTLSGADFVEIGRAKIHIGLHSDHTRMPSDTFAATNHALRLMESVGVCIRENEPILLVGETGCGKTTLIQQLAANCERELIVQNLSLQTDSTDLLGGYRPLELRNVARKVYQDFVDIFVATFSRKQNAKFLQYASSMHEKSNWKKMSQCLQRAAKLGLAKMKEQTAENSTSASSQSVATLSSWTDFSKTSERFERQRLSCDAGLAFVFSEGALVDAIQSGKWVLLDEINLASSDTLQRLCGLLDEPGGSVTLTERGDASAIKRHPNFRLFAAMNPATDAGKKDLPSSIRSRFSELYVDELLDPVELRVVAARYLDGVLPINDKPPEHMEIVVSAVDVYLKCRELAETLLSDGGGHKPRYTLRTLSRALSAAKNVIIQQRIPLRRAVYEGFQLAFEGALDVPSVKVVKKILKSLLADGTKSLDHPGRKPGGKNEAEHILVKPFWIKAGPIKPLDWSETSATGKSRFVLTASVSSSLRQLSRALAAGPWPVLLEGPTSAGKTTLVEYIAARCGHHVIRINNHEHTDVQEYTGSFAADNTGSLSFRDGLLVQALRRGHWVILDELNLAPSEVLEALNRLLDDNRELYLAEINETVKPHPNFRLFATQNPCGAYGGRKPLSRAFRNRFVEIHMSDIPSNEMITILEKRCACPPSHSKILVDIMVTLRHRRSKSNLFLGKDSFITPRDLLRWAERKASSKLELAEQGYMLLAERLRSEEEKLLVREVLEENLKVNLDMEEFYFGESSQARKLLKEATEDPRFWKDSFLSSIAPTKSLLRLICLVLRCIKQKEPVLLVGDTGCGKTTVVQFLSLVFRQTLYAVNCHATTETSDLIGGLRPVRGRDVIQKKILNRFKHLILRWPYKSLLREIILPDYIDLENTSEPPTLDVDKYEGNDSDTKETYDVRELLSIAKTVFKARPIEEGSSDNERERNKKRRKMTSSSSPSASDDSGGEEVVDSLKPVMEEIEELCGRYTALFEWSDGPLVHAMKSGQMLLLDEMSLAEDAVLERLNSVLEPSRTLVLAEKGDDGSKTESRVIVANDGFRIFATMNPGGDFGKKELSPALRSRFTEIWVPAVTDRCDFELVLGRTLVPRSNVQDITACPPAILGCMLAYVEWFNISVCGEASSPYSGYALTLRDVLSWARFIVESREANAKLGIWEAYCHGTCLMHLDGLGLGAGLALEDATKIKGKADSFLLAQIPEGVTVSNLGGTEEKFGTRNDGKFGASPFSIRVGPLPIPKSYFNLAAPTTALNTFRVLRAMQLKKPVLLEGSPGVGKTSLITALAAASGHKLVRINLSEQTDIADLMGSDLPVQNSGTGGASFEWCDGILLTAIKEGSWVLLDELNLASQSVLEGLNSCLDHRATVFIPELGQTFHCPETFRVFGAQNPLGQGGGRKGLPKSFLNRFTKVFVDPLTDSDLRAIVGSRFPSFEKNLVDRLIDFNNTIHRDVVDKREYGAEGSPWEFNLRDVFRSCELISASLSSSESFARDLYFQRFRTQDDRNRVDETFKKYFNCSLKPLRPPEFRVTDSSICIGGTTLHRFQSVGDKRDNPLHSEPEFFLSQLLPMEAVARCVSLRWPCLLVGATGSGKTSIVASLAELSNVTLVEQCLSPSSDVTELLGCFEQVETMSEIRKNIKGLCDLANEYLLHHSLQTASCQRVWGLLSFLFQCLQTLDESGFLFFNADGAPCSKASDLCRILLRESSEKFCTQNEEKINVIASVIDMWGQAGGTRKCDDAGHFIWRDGVLVEAMLKGYWLLLENVNLCPSSVLDRLNSVMEKDGELLLSECGTQDGEDSSSSSHRLIKPHPNFRVFLTMNPANGEISRAMRNRCVEISLLQPIKTDVSQGKDIERPGVAATMTKGEKIDFLGGLRHAGARSLQLASALLHTHTDQHAKSIIAGEEPPCLRSVSGSVSMLTGLLMRGLSGDTAMRSCLQLSYEIEEEAALQLLTNAKFNILKSKTPTPLPQISPIRSSWLVSASTAHVEWEARLLRSFVGNKSNIVDELTDSQLGLLSLTGSNPRLVEAYQQILALQMKPQLDGRFQDIMIQLFLSKVDALDMETRFSYLNGLESTCSSALSWMASVIRKEFLNPRVTHDPMQYSGENPSAHAVIVPTRNPYISSKIHVVQLGRLNQKLREHKWHQRVSTQHAALESLSEFSVLETSFYIHETLLDRTKIPCPVTPIVYPLLNSLDRWISCLLHDSCHLVETEEATFVGILSPFLEERDRLWCHLEECPMTLQPDSFLGFEEAEFIVQWKWLKKRYACLSSAFSISFSDESFALKQRVDALATAIDEVLFGSAIEAWSSHSIRKHMIRPIVPKHEKQWEALFELRTLAEASTIISDRRFCPLESSKNPVDLKELVDIHHPILFLPKDDKAQLLAALCTLHWSWTDEVEGVKRSDNSIFVNTLFHGRIKESFEQKRQDFIAEVELAKVDLDIATVENQFSVEALERLKDSSALTISSSDTYSRVAKSLLQSFGRIQLSFLAEFWCTCEENRLTGEICRSLLEYEEDKQLSQKLSHLLSDVKRFVNVVLASTIWSINDIQPYQTLIWAVEGWSEKHGSLKTLLRRLLSTMLFAASKHLWSNSFIDESAVSMHLELPSAWGDDEAINHRPICTGDLSPCFGSVRLRQQVRSEFMLRLLGKQLVLVKGGEVNFKFHTMENHLCRLFQYREMVQMLSSFQFPVSKASLHIVQYLFVDILEALRVRFRDEAIVHLILLAKQPESLLRTSGNDILRLGNNCKNDFCRRYCSDLIAPLFGCIQRASNMKEDSLEYAKETALAFVHLGLLRLTILVPDTPLDPGRAPLAKITLINRKLGTVSTNITALRLDSGFIYGDFMPESSDMIDFLTEGESLIKKRSSQQKKVVERLKTSPPFHELFRETRDFVQRVSANGAVVQLVQMLCGTSSTELEDGRGRALNWQKTAAAFCQRLTDDYAAYEDLTAALVDAVKMIQNGLHVLTEPESTRCDTFISQLFGLLVQFPMRGHSEIVQSTMELLTMLSRETITLNKRGKSDLHFGLSLAVLARLVLKKRLVGLSNDEWVSSCAIFDALTKSHLVQSDESIKGESIEDVQEREFREQFPDYRREFHGLLEESMPEDLYDTEIPREEEKSATVEDTFVLSDQQIGLLCSIYQDLFSEDTTGVSDSARALAFHSGYSAAYQLEESFKCSKKPALGSEPVGGHVFAMALTSVPKMGSVRVHSHLHNGASMVDFQNEPCPAESMLAMGPLERLMARATQLLTAFPGHPILIGIGKVCDKVCKFDLMATPIGKVMTGLEVILRQAQDWEQHASDRVRLGVSLQEIGQLVARWRKRELESWSKLIRSRQDRHVRRAQKHWVRLHSVLHNDGVGSSQSFTVKEPSVNAFTDCQPCTPNWVWKGLVFMKQALSDSAEDLRLDDLRELVKVLDTFVLTSPLGEYEERLKLIKSSSLQLQTEYNASNKTSSWRLQQSRALLSVWFYYHQFLPVISSKLEALRKPIETKLKDEVKLAKWDEQSYYALAESTERNHRKLMKILSEFDESLGLNVGLLIQEETCRGIRSESDTRDEFCSSVPSDSLMFPISLDMKEDRRSGVVKEIFYGRVGNNTGNWVDASVIGTPSDSHLARIAKYARKMQLLTKGGGLLSESWATIGENEISSFCDSIFERIGSLREKSTRPMKERALVDLFREMKKNGFTVTKWSVPDELRRMEQIFQLPKPNIAFSRLRKTDVLTLDRAEKYYMRCLVEMNALRSETLMLGSKYMSKREMNLMVGLSESGMLMLAQQRSLVSNVIVDIAVLTDHASAMQLDSGDLPVLQSTLQPLVMNFEKNYSSTLETLRQLSLLLKSSQTLLLGNKKTDWARDAIAKLESFPLSSYVDAKHIKADIVTWGKLQCIEKDYTCLREIERVIRECREECRILGCFPVDIFDAPLSIISETLCIASECKKCVDDRGSVNGRGSNASDFSKSLSSTIEKTLITFQNFCQDASISNLTNEKKDPDEPGVDSIDISIWECHRGLAKAWAGLRLQDLNQTLVDLLQQLTSLQDTTPVSKDERKCYIGLLRDAGVLVKNIQSLSETLLGDSLSLYSTAAKLNYIILRVFRVLVSKGYCSDKSSEDDGGDADGDINGMTFEDDQDGTGMGEGDGKRDVTDQLENEEQLLGLKSDQDNETDKPENQESRQLNEDEAEQGMEMEGDFDGEMCDLPENSADDDMDEKDGEEELERELGEDSSPDEQVVDERMWNESDDEEEIKKDEEKFEKNSSVDGEAIEGETRTKDDDENEKPSEDKNEKQTEASEPKGGQENDGEVEGNDDEGINEDNDDRYEDQQGVDVRGEENEADDASNTGEDEMELGDDICLDGEDDGDADMDDNVVEEEDIDDSGSTGSSESKGNNQEALHEGDDEEEADNVDSSTVPTGEGTVNPLEDEQQGETDAPDEAMDEEIFDNTTQQPDTEEAHGIKSSQGTDAVKEEGDEEEGDEGADEGDEPTGGTSGTSQADNSQSDANGGAGYSERDGTVDESTDMKNEENTSDVPNPFKDPGDASKFWHKKLDVVESNPEADESTEGRDNDDSDSQDKKNGDFQFTSADQKSTSQVLGETTQEEAVELEAQEREEEVVEDTNDGQEAKKQDNEEQQEKRKNETSRQSKKLDSTKPKLDETSAEKNDVRDESVMDEEVKEEEDEMSEASEKSEEDRVENEAIGNKVVSDLSKIAVTDEDTKSLVSQMVQDEQVSGISTAEAAEARSRWLKIQGETHNLSRRLCEKLRLVMEPLVASKLRGDYRSGKRINMKRVIGYIASGYRKDKIWLRRTKPAKRDYRVLLAVDDSESMKKSGAGEMALRAMATLAIGMNQLEIGELGVASFGDDMKLLHPFHLPFTSETGADMVMSFGFNQPRTRTALCVESAIASLESFGGHSSMQLVFLISDGRIERDSRAALKRLIREMVERNILLAMIIVEGEHKKKDSIVNMKEVSFVKGKPVVKRFIEDYPFPYYIILDDMTALPEVMGDALRQWFEMLGQLKGSG